MIGSTSEYNMWEENMFTETAANGEMRICMGNGNTGRKSSAAPCHSCLPQSPLDLTWNRSQAVAVGNGRPIALAAKFLVSAAYWGQHLMKSLFRPFISTAGKDVNICRQQLIKWERSVTVTELTPLLRLAGGFNGLQSRLQRTAVTTVTVLAKNQLHTCPEPNSRS
jgi:hypothetical protein